MNLYQATSPNIGANVLIIKANNPKEASQVARDLIEETHLSECNRFTVYVVELIQPEKDNPGYCYPSASEKIFQL